MCNLALCNPNFASDQEEYPIQKLNPLVISTDVELFKKLENGAHSTDLSFIYHDMHKINKNTFFRYCCWKGLWCCAYGKKKDETSKQDTVAKTDNAVAKQANE